MGRDLRWFDFLPLACWAAAVPLLLLVTDGRLSRLQGIVCVSLISLVFGMGPYVLIDALQRRQGRAEDKKREAEGQ